MNARDRDHLFIVLWLAMMGFFTLGLAFGLVLR